MKLISYECPYEEYVLYRKEKDSFQSLIIATIEDEKHGTLECEVELHKIFPYTEWKIGSIYFFNRKYAKQYVNKLRKWLHTEIGELFQKIEAEEENVRKQYEHVPKIEILQVEKKEEYESYLRGNRKYRQNFRMKLAPFNKFFSVYVKKERNKDFIIVEMKKRKDDNSSMEFLGYPDWKRDFQLAVLHYWKSETGDLLEQEEKIELYENTMEKWDSVKNHIYNRGGEKERA